MPLVLNNEFVLEINDKLSGEVLEFRHRLPTQAERNAFTKATLKHKGNKVVSKANQFEEQAAMGKRVLLGFRKGCLANASGDLISADKGDPDYCAEWRDLLAKQRPDILAAIGRRVLQSTSTPEDEGAFEVVEDFEGDPSMPLFDDTSRDAEAEITPPPSA